MTAVAMLTERLTANVGVSHTIADYDEAVSTEIATWPTFAPDGDISGQDIAHLGDDRERRTDVQRYVHDGLGYFVRGDVSYRSPQYTGADNLAELPERTLLNMRAGLEGGNWTVELWGANLTDDDSASMAFHRTHPWPRFPCGPFPASIAASLLN